MNPSKWIILIPLIIGMGMNLFVKREKLDNCGSINEMTPPPYVFFIVWPILYLIIGYVYYQYLKKYSINSPFSIFMIVTFILLNLWNVVFRNYCSPKISLISILLITILYYYIVYQLIKLNIKYSYLMIALLVWMMYATILVYFSNV